ncbi:MAG: hypothetical protein MPW15_18695 [Candidatus Manganitrophus sp.]|nr:hypothetical protein [Candidatus Manganitrophus sp.]
MDRRESARRTGVGRGRVGSEETSFAEREETETTPAKERVTRDE